MARKGEVEALRVIRGAGAEVARIDRRRRHTHVWIRTPGGVRKVVCSKSPSCPRTLLNLRALVRRMVAG